MTWTIDLDHGIVKTKPPKCPDCARRGVEAILIFVTEQFWDCTYLKCGYSPIDAVYQCPNGPASCGFGACEDCYKILCGEVA